MVVAEMIAAIGAAARETAADLKVATEAARENNEASDTTSTMGKAPGGGASTMGASAGGNVTTTGMTLAIRQQQGRL